VLAAIGCEDHRAFLVARVDELEEQIASACDDWEVADFIDDERGEPAEELDLLAQSAFAFGLGERTDQIGEPALAAVAGLGFEPIDEIDDIVEPTARAGANAASRNGDGEMGLAGSGRSSDIMAGITATVSGFIIRFTRAAGTLWLLFGVSVSKAETCSSSINSMERWRIFPAG